MGIVANQPLVLAGCLDIKASIKATHFIRASREAGIAFIGPTAEVLEPLRNKIIALQMAQAAGFLTPQHSSVSFGTENLRELEVQAAELGYPVIIKSCSWGRGRGERLAQSAHYLAEAVRQAQVVSMAVYGSRRVYLEKAILPAYQVGVQIMGDNYGNLIHLGEREGSVLQNGNEIVEEAPAISRPGAVRTVMANSARTWPPF